MLRVVRELLTRVPQASLRPRLKSPRRAPRFEVFIWNLSGLHCCLLIKVRCVFLGGYLRLATAL